MSTRLTADTRHLDDLVSLALAGRIRIPAFQRKMRWTSENVCLFFDSVYRGYPVGTLLFWIRPGSAGTSEFGAVTVETSDESSAWWVVDGQQRLTSMVAALRHPRPDATDVADPFLVWFDLEREKFVPAPGDARIPDTWIPLSRVGEPLAYAQWLLQSVARQANKVHLERAQQLATRIRNYRVPLYTVEGAEEAEVRDIFNRTNEAGRRMRAHEVFDALVGARGGALDRLDELADSLEDVGFGRFEPGLLHSCALAVQGLDVTQGGVAGKVADYTALHDSYRRVRESLVRAVAFLRDDAHVPHERLLPYPRPILVTLARLFDQTPEPGLNARRLLVRWVWRCALTNRPATGERTYLRQCPENVDGNAEASALRLLADVGRVHAWRQRENSFDARFSADRVALLALATLNPLDLETGAAIPVADLLDTDAHHAVGRIVGSGHGQATAANRIFANGLSSGRVRGALLGSSAAVLRSHAVPETALDALRQRDDDTFLSLRRAHLDAVVREQGQRYAEWAHKDRPSLVLDADDAA